MNNDFAARATFKNGIMRWNSNNRVPPRDIVEQAARLGFDVDGVACNLARDAELAAFLADYRRNYTGPSAEERMEARAALGAGAEVVNVITGHRLRA